MLYLLSISVTLVGAAILVALILFSHRNEDSERTELCESGEGETIGEFVPSHGGSGNARADGPPRGTGSRETGPPPAGRPGHGGDTGFSRESTRAGAGDASGEDKGSVSSGDADTGAAGARTLETDRSAADRASSIPIIRPGAEIPGLGKFELVHFLGKAGFGTLEDERDLEEIRIEGNEPQLELQGEIALTSKHIIVFDAQNAKKIPFGIIEKYRFQDSFLIIKKKKAKKKKTLLKIFVNTGEFRYILGALIPL
jgi:hypothetical protein